MFCVYIVDNFDTLDSIDQDILYNNRKRIFNVHLTVIHH